MKLQTPTFTHADLVPPRQTRRQAEAAAEQLQAFARAMHETATRIGVTFTQATRQLVAFANSGAMTSAMRAHVRRRGYPRTVVATIVTPTGTECRVITQGLGGWR